MPLSEYGKSLIDSVVAELYLCSLLQICCLLLTLYCVQYPPVDDSIEGDRAGPPKPMRPGLMLC